MEGLQNWVENAFGNEFGSRQMVVLPTGTLHDYLEHPLVRRLYLTDVGYFATAKNHFRERENGCEEYIFFYCTQGSGTIIVENRVYTLHENEAFCIPKGKKHCYYASEKDPWSILWVHLKGEDIRYYPLEDCKMVTFDSKNTGSRMQFLFEQIFRVLEDNYSLGNFIYITQVLSMILAEIYCRKKEDTVKEQNSHITDVIKYMYSHLNENLTLEQIVQEFDFSKSYLNMIFRKYTQHAPMEYFLNLKMKRACELLKEDGSYVYEVAQKLGYADQYYFSRIFKRVVGVSPKDYRKGGVFYHIQ